MQTRPLGKTGLEVSVLSFGASSLGGVFHDIDESQGIRTVHTALDLGINFIDVSPYYGATRAESVLGKALQTVPRDRYILATKVGQYGDGDFDFSAARVRRSLDESCARLGVETVDLLQCHDIEFADLNQIVDETLPELVKLRDEGRIRHIGITGLPLKIFSAVLERVEPGVVDTILSFCHYELNDDSLNSVLPLCKERGVGVINASPTGMGLLTERGCPSWHPASETIQAGARRAVEFCREIGVNLVEVAIWFSISHSDIATTLVGTANPDNIRANVGYAERAPDAAVIAQVREVLAPIMNLNFTRGRPENRDPVLTEPTR